MRNKMNLSPPWVTFYKEVVALFGDDPDIRVEYDEENNVIKMYVEDHDKADALDQILPKEKAFGGVTVYIEVIPKNKELSKVDLFKKAFEGNPAYSFSTTIDGVFVNPISYVVFRNKVVQFWNDDLGDINGNCNTLYQDLAKDIFEDAGGICFSTDLPDNLGVAGKK